METGQPDRDSTAFLAGGGEMGERTRKLDWSKTPLGPVERWPQSLRSALSICLNASFPIALYWGNDLVLLYNDDWSPIPGEKHPWALGRPGREVWPEIWDTIGPLFEQVVTTGRATRRQDQLLPMRRHGFTEECYFDYTFSPVRGESGTVDGVFNAVVETTTRVVGERRLRTLRELAARTTGEAKSPEEACRAAARHLADNPRDVPFALFYLLGDDERAATLAGWTGVEPGTPISPAAFELSGDDGPWPFRRVLETGQAVEVRGLSGRFGPLPGGAWPEPSDKAVVLPMSKPGQAHLAGFVVTGVSPRLPLDDDYRGFMALLAGHVAAAVADARAYVEERRRSEALAELDRAKTAFFSNVSHEFRTPLTLMLGPVEDLLAGDVADLPAAVSDRLELVNRNGLRLLRLVNSLLDFSRIEAGRVRAVFRPTDLAAFTAELASVFRSACERAGLRLVVDCPPLPEPAYVDREMWEKVVLNLISNAFKFTFAGEIAVSLRRAGDAAELRVSDTGTGIPAGEMPKLFERFHRVENARGRTHEGSGIGLALVQELVKLHGGTVSAESEAGRGTTFVVTVPLGSSHLPPDRLGESGEAAPAGPAAAPFVEEALRWLPDQGADRGAGPAAVEEPAPEADPFGAGAGGVRPRVLVADDNADMRNYVVRLLSDRYRVEAVADGEAALASARDRTPDLVLTDVMMPRLDGFGLLRELRSDPATSGMPVILLSARAGEESRVEGLEAGADDYLVKPFSARELLARVGAHLQMARLRRESEQAVRESEERFRLFMEHSPTTAFIKDEEGRYVFVNRHLERQFGRPAADWLGKTDFDLFRPDEAERFRRNDLAVLSSGATAEFDEPAVQPDGPHHYHSYKFRLKDRRGRPLLAGMALDVTERKRIEEAVRQSQARFEALFDAAPIGAYLVDADLRLRLVNPEARPVFGDVDPLIGRDFAEVVRLVWPQPLADDVVRRFRHTLETGEPYFVPEVAEQRLDRKVTEYYEWHISRVALPEGGFGVVCYFNDISRHVLAREALAEADRRKTEFLATLGHELRNPLAPIRTGLELLRLAGDDPALVGETLDTMERQVGQMVRLIDDLLDVSRITQGKLRLRTCRVDLADVVRDAVEAARPMIDESGHDLSVRLPERPVRLDADPARLAQVISNLLNNAAKYTPDGGHIRLTAERQGGDVAVAVRDDGIGIPVGMLDRIFEMFSQIDRQVESGYKGLGIGLTLVKRLIEMHGGTVEARSEGEGKGSEFVVRLPAVPEEESDRPARPARAGEAAPSGGLRILVVDDNRAAADLLGKVVRVLGNEARTAYDGEQGVAAAAEFRPDVILMDLGMPNMDGYEAAREIRRRPWGAGMLLVALTGWGQDEDRRRTSEAGFDRHLVKPAEPAALQALFAEVRAGRARSG